MSKIQIGNLHPAGAELFQGGESFLTELQATEAHTIHGGTCYGKKSKKSKKSKSKSYGPVGKCPPYPCLPVHC
jgi:hypothetical protein